MKVWCLWDEGILWGIYGSKELAEIKKKELEEQYGKYNCPHLYISEREVDGK